MTALLSARPTPAAPAPHAAAPAEDAPWVEREAFVTAVFAERVDEGGPLLRYVLRHPRRSLRALAAIAALPARDAVLPPGPEADVVRRLLTEHAGSRRLMLGVSAVLDTPERPGTYSEGHARATVRRKVRAATRQGITVRAVRDDERIPLLALADRHERLNEREAYRIDAPDNRDLAGIGLWLVAVDGDGAPLMLAVIPCAGEWAALRYFRTLTAGQASSDARYLMAEALAETLGAAGVRHLVDTARPHWLPNGLRHFQRMIGFRLVRVRRVRVAGS